MARREAQRKVVDDMFIHSLGLDTKTKTMLLREGDLDESGCEDYDAVQRVRRINEEIIEQGYRLIEVKSNLDLKAFMADPKTAKPSRDIAAHKGTLPPLVEVKLPRPRSRADIIDEPEYARRGRWS